VLHAEPLALQFVNRGNIVNLEQNIECVYRICVALLNCYMRKFLPRSAVRVVTYIQNRTASRHKHTHTHTNTRTHTHTNSHTPTHEDIHTHKHTDSNTYTCTNTDAYISLQKCSECGDIHARPYC
jgi:ABC-type nickel/cobalt efflux system permease component RcnA